MVIATEFVKGMVCMGADMGLSDESIVKTIDQFLPMHSSLNGPSASTVQDPK